MVCVRILECSLRAAEGVTGVLRSNRVQHLHQEITITRRHGSFTFEESLARLVQLGQLERREALARTGHPEELDLLLRNTPVTPPRPHGGCTLECERRPRRPTRRAPRGGRLRFGHSPV